MDFCEGSVPTFFAYRNDGGAWTTVTADANGSFSFTADPKVVITFVRNGEAETFYTSAQDLVAISGVPCVAAGTKTLSGSFQNIAAGGYGLVTAGASRAVGGNFTLTKVPNGPVDLLAVNVEGSTPPSEAIVRRNQNLASGSTIPAFDFAAPEAVAMPSNQVTANGLVMAGGDLNYLFINMTSANGTTTGWDHGTGFTATTRTFRSFPSSLLTTGDVHELHFLARADMLKTSRQHRLFYRDASDKTVELGPKASSATFTSVATTPNRRVRGTMPSQPEYGRAARFQFVQTTANGGERYWYVTGTARYFGGTAPSTWELEMPDMSAVTGFPASAGFQANQTTFASATVFSELYGLWIGPRPSAGASVKAASPAGTTIPAQ